MSALHPRLLEDGAPADHVERDRLVVIGDVEDLIVDVLERSPEIIVGDARIGYQPVHLDLDVGFHARSSNRLCPAARIATPIGPFSNGPLSRSTAQLVCSR